MMRAASRLVRCAAKAAAALDPEDTTVRDIRELAATLKELSSLRASALRAEEDAPQTVEVHFADGEQWSL